MADRKRKTGDYGGEPIAGTPSCTVISCTMPYIRDSRDRGSVSLVCKKWCELEAQTRKSVTIRMCYAVTPRRLRRRFPLLESLTLKGKPKAAMFGLVPEDWGGGVTPWVEEIAGSMNCLNSVNFRRMVVSDSDLRTLAEARGERLRVLKLDWCSGFSTDGLLHVSKYCSNLKVLYMQDCTIVERDGAWLGELAKSNSGLEVLNFYGSDLVKFRFEDLELLAENCGHSLVSVKISDYELLDLVGFFDKAVKLEEFGGGSFNCKEFDKYNSRLKYPPTIKMLAPDYMGRNEMPIVLPLAARLTKLDLRYAFIDSEDHCFLIQRCPNLETLLARDAIGDRGLQVVGRCCKKMRRIHIVGGADDEEGFVSHKGLIALAQGCLELESIYVHVTDIVNEALECVGEHLKKLYNFQMILLEKGGTWTDFPLDNGIRSLLLGCLGIRRLWLYLRTGALTDVGMGCIGQHGLNIQCLFLGSPGGSDAGLLEMSKGLPKVETVLMRGCPFSELGLAQFVANMPRLKYLWVDGYKVSASGHDILAMARPFWNMELLTSRQSFVTDARGRTVVFEEPLALLAYFSLAGQRTDLPPHIIPLHLTMVSV